MGYNVTMTLYRINKSIGRLGNYEQPIITSNGYSIFFREYLPNTKNAVLVGLAIAYPIDRMSSNPRFFACQTGANCEPFEFKRGGEFPPDKDAGYPTVLDELTTLRTYKERAVEKLAAHVKEISSIG